MTRVKRTLGAPVISQEEAHCILIENQTSISMSIYSNPQPLEHFLDKLRNCKEIKDHLKSNGHQSFDGFSDDEIFDYIEDIVQNDGIDESSIDALGAYDDVFGIYIYSFADIVYWIKANEFDDIKYFSSHAEAANYAQEEFESFIGALKTFEAENEDS